LQNQDTRQLELLLYIVLQLKEAAIHFCRFQSLFVGVICGVRKRIASPSLSFSRGARESIFAVFFLFSKSKKDKRQKGENPITNRDCGFRRNDTRGVGIDAIDTTAGVICVVRKRIALRNSDRDKCDERFR
jgi:hypothetical protein